MTTFAETVAKFEFEKVDIYKKASLVLSSLDKEDQSWVLENLPQYQSKKLKLLIEELSSLGLNQDDQLIKKILDENNVNEFHDERDLSAEYSEVLKRLDKFSVDQVKDILSDEPVHSVAMVLSVKNWSWATKYLTSLPDDVAKEIRILIKDYVGKISHPIKVSIVEYLDEFSAVKGSADKVGYAT